MGAPTPGYATSDEKTWALVAHFGGAAGALLGWGSGGWVAPLVALLAKGNESPTIRANAIQALNFQILCTIVAIVGWMTVCIGIGFVLLFVAAAAGIVFGVLGGIKANEGVPYKYPISLNLIK